MGFSFLFIIGFEASKGIRRCMCMCVEGVSSEAFHRFKTNSLLCFINPSEAFQFHDPRPKIGYE